MSETKKIVNCKKTGETGFSYIYVETLNPGEAVYLKMPCISSNKRGVNDIGFMASENVSVEATFSNDIDDPKTMWQEILPYSGINKTISFLKIKNRSDNTEGQINIRVILN